MATDFVGKTFGSYKLVAQLGRGGMASVYRGYQESIDRSVAVKVLPPEYLHDPNFAERFVAEARMLAKLTHPSILSLYDFGTANDVPYIVMPLMARGTLADRLSRGPMPLPEVLRIMQPVASALDYAHKQGIIHRDLKPSNILFDQNDAPFLGDFGIAKALESTSGLTGTGIIGTPDYMSPEQAQGEKIDNRSDIYALGVVVYQILTGQQLFHATTPMGIVLKHLTEAPPHVRLTIPEISEAVDAAVAKALAKRPDDRYQTATEFIAALGSAAGQPKAASPDYAPPGDMRTMLKPAALPSGLTPGQPRPLTPPPPAASRPPTPGTPMPPVTPPPSGVSRPPTPGTPMPPPAGVSRPPTPGTPMPAFMAPPYPTPTGELYPQTPGTSMPPQATPRKRGVGGFLLGSSLGIAVGIGLIVLLIGACCAGIYGLSLLANTPTPPATLPPARTLAPLATSTPPVPAGVVLMDDFSDSASGWEVSSSSSSALGYMDGEYSIKALETNWFIWSNPRKVSYTNIRAEVEASEAAQTSNVLFGLMCDFQDNQHYYFAGVDTQANYVIAKHDGETTTYLSGGGKIQNSTKMARGGNYRLAVECGYGVIALYVDGILIDSVEDATFSDGNIGLFLDVFSPDGSSGHTPKEIEARFDNLKVAALPETPPTPRPATATPAALPSATRLSRATSTPASSTGGGWMMDTFSSNQYNWATGVDDNDYATIDREIIRGSYQWTVKTKKGMQSHNAPVSAKLADFIVAVEAQRTSGDPGVVGLFFREDDSSNRYFYALSDTNRTYGVFVYSGGKWKTLIDYKKSTAIQTDRTNWMAVRAEGNHFTFYINNQLVDELDDSSLPQAGNVGLTVEMADPNLKAEFKFDNFRFGPPEMLTFLDGFSKDMGTWNTKSDTDVQRAFKDGQYHITVVKNATAGWSTLGEKFADFEVEVEATQLEGPNNNNYGVIVRYVDSDNFYRFVISGDGNYSFQKLKQGDWDTLIDWKASSAIHMGQSTNIIRVICKGDTFTFYVNDFEVDSYTDSDFASGDLALAAGKYSDAGNVHISFDNVRVWVLK